MIPLCPHDTGTADIAYMADVVSDGRHPQVTPAVQPAVQDVSRPVSQTPDLGAVFANALVADITALVRHHVGPVSPGLTGLSAFSRSVPAPLARDVVPAPSL